MFLWIEQYRIGDGAGETSLVWDTVVGNETGLSRLFIIQINHQNAKTGRDGMVCSGQFENFDKNVLYCT